MRRDDKGVPRVISSVPQCNGKKNWEIDKRHGTMGNVMGDGKDV